MHTKANLPLLPLRDIVVFPSMVIPLFVGRDKSITALNEVMQNEKKIILVTQKNAEVDDPKKNDVFNYGCESSILQLLKLPDGTVKVLVEGIKRVKIVDFKDDEKFITCAFEHQNDELTKNEELLPLALTAIKRLEKLSSINRKLSTETINNINPKKLPEISNKTRIGACVSNPQKFIGIGLNYSDHAEETGMKIPSEPIVFLKANSCITGPYDDVLIPKKSKNKRNYSYSASDRFDEVTDKIRAVKTKKYKYIRNYDINKPHALNNYYRTQMALMRHLTALNESNLLSAEQKLWFNVPKNPEEFYDLENDPFELNNLIGEKKYSKEIENLRIQLDNWIDQINDPVNIPEKELVKMLTE